MAFDILGAKREGYTDTEIADHLATSQGFNAVSARNEGYSDQEIIGHLLGKTDVGAPFNKSTQEESGYLGGTLKALGRGIAGIPVQAGHAMQWNEEYQRTGDESKLNVVNRLGKGIADVSERVRDAIPEPGYGTSEVKRSVFQGVESLPVSMAYAVPSTAGAIIGGGLGVVDSGGAASIPQAIAGAAAGQALSAPIMYRASAQETAEQLQKQAPNLDRNSMVDAAKKAGHAEWQGETISDIPEALIYSRIPGLKAGADTVKALLKPGLKQFLKNYAMTLPAEQLGEGFTAYRQTHAMNEVLPEYQQQSAWGAVAEQAGPTAVMSLLMGAGGTGLQRLRSNRIASNLENPEVDPDSRYRSAAQAAQLVRDSQGDDAANNFLQHAALAIGNEQETGSAPTALNLSDPKLLLPPGQAQETTVAAPPIVPDISAATTDPLSPGNDVPSAPALSPVSPDGSKNPLQSALLTQPVDLSTMGVTRTPALSIQEQAAQYEAQPQGLKSTYQPVDNSVALLNNRPPVELTPPGQAITGSGLEFAQAKQWAKGRPELLQQRGEKQADYKARLMDSFNSRNKVPTAPVLQETQKQTQAFTPVAQGSPSLDSLTDEDRNVLSLERDMANSWERGSRDNGRSNKLQIMPYLVGWGKTTPAEVATAIDNLLTGKKLGYVQQQLVVAALEGGRERFRSMPAPDMQSTLGISDQNKQSTIENATPVASNVTDSANNSIADVVPFEFTPPSRSVAKQPTIREMIDQRRGMSASKVDELAKQYAVEAGLNISQFKPADRIAFVNQYKGWKESQNGVQELRQETGNAQEVSPVRDANVGQTFNWNGKEIGEAIARALLPQGYTANPKLTANGDFLGTINIQHNGKDVGYVNADYDHTTNEVHIVKSDIAPEHQGKGLAKSIYRQINDALVSRGQNTLKSDKKNMTQAAINLWQSLVRDGVARERQDGVQGYEFVPNASENQTIPTPAPEQSVVSGASPSTASYTPAAVDMTDKKLRKVMKDAGDPHVESSSAHEFAQGYFDQLAGTPYPDSKIPSAEHTGKMAYPEGQHDGYLMGREAARTGEGKVIRRNVAHGIYRQFHENQGVPTPAPAPETPSETKSESQTSEAAPVKDSQKKPKNEQPSTQAVEPAPETPVAMSEPSGQSANEIYSGYSDKELDEALGRFQQNARHFKEWMAAGNKMTDAMQERYQFAQQRIESIKAEIIKRNQDAITARKISAAKEVSETGILTITKNERKKIMQNVGDVYRDGKAPRELKGFDRNGNEIFGYEYTPDLFIKSDLSGKQIRHYVMLPDGRIAHPDEIKEAVTRGRIKIVDQLTESNKQEQTKLDDFGEKLEGARKDQQPSLERELSDDDISKLPLSEIWPKKEIDAIEDVGMAAFATAARAEVPAKPKKGYKLDRWVGMVKAVRGLVQHAQRMGLDAFYGKMVENHAVLNRFVAKAKLLSELPRESWGRIGSVEEYPTSYRFGEGGEKIPAPHSVVEIDGKRRVFESGTVQDALGAIREALGQEAQAKHLAFEVRGREGQGFAINRKGDPLYRPLMKFETAKEALEFARNMANYQSLLKAWEDLKEKDNVKERDLRSDVNRPRKGADHRKGKDATPEMFSDAFGFRGVQFGNWMKQGAGRQERQGAVNAAYDALMDLADIVGIPPKAISLNGTLGLSFGARGTGWASAHYEPDTLVINLTKTRGAGSLAHEWFHALDNYFALKRGNPAFNGNQDQYRNEHYVTHKPEPMMVHTVKMSAPISRKRLMEMHAANPKSEYWQPAYWQIDPKHPEGIRPEVEAAFADLVKALNDSPMAKRSALIDKGSGGYWSRTLERAARAFENYTIFRMMRDGYHNDYLANVVNEKEFTRDIGRYPYLMEGEIAPVAEAFDNLFGTIKTEETDKGVAMYLRRGGNNARQNNPLPNDQFDSVVSSVTSGWSESDRQAVILRNRFDELPPEIQADAVSNGYDDKTTNNPIPGVTYKGTIYLVRQNVFSREQLEEALLHEYLHRIMKGQGNKHLTYLMNNLLAKMGGGKGLVDLAAQAGFDFSPYRQQAAGMNLKQRQAFYVEEFLANIEGMRAYEKIPQKTVRAIREFWGKFRDWLRDNKFSGIAKYVGMNLDNFTQADLAFTLHGIRSWSARMFDDSAIRFLSVNGPFMDLDKGIRKKFLARATKEYKEVEKRYKNTPQWGKAPNGANTNLNIRQWVQVRTQLFKEWFGDWEKAHNGKDGNGVWAVDFPVSKVVDENGEPLVVYHGTKQGGFVAFDPTEADRHRSPMIFAAKDRQTARTYSGIGDEIDITAFDYEDEYGEYDKERGIYSLFLNIRNPHETNFEGANWDGDRRGFDQYVVYDENDEQYYDETGKGIFSYDEAESIAENLGDDARYESAPSHYETTNSAAEEAKRYNHDGTIIRQVIDEGGEGYGYGDVTDVFVFFDSAQAKSAISNSGLFIEDDGNLMYSRSSAPVGNAHSVDSLRSELSGSGLKVNALENAFLKIIESGKQLPENVRSVFNRLSAWRVESVDENGRPIILFNPTAAEMSSFLSKTNNGRVRVVVDPVTQDMYVADAGVLTHDVLAYRAGVPWDSVSGNPDNIFFLDRNFANDRRFKPGQTGRFSLISDKSGIKGVVTPDGMVYLVADQIAKGEGYNVALHEIGVHYGLEGFVGADGKAQILKQMENLKKNDNKAVVEAFNLVPKDTAAHLVTEEALGYLAEINPRHLVIRRIMSAVKSFLFKHGFLKAESLNDADLLAIAKGSMAKVNREAGQAGMTTPKLVSAMASLREKLQPFFSQLETVIPKMGGRMPVADLFNMLKKNGVTDAEIDTVLDDIREQGGTVTKQQVIETIAANSVELQDVVLGDDEANYPRRNELIKELRELIRANDNLGFDFDREAASALINGQAHVSGYEWNSDDDAMKADAIIKEHGSLRVKKPQFSEYVEPGAIDGSYREMFVTTPVSREKWLKLIEQDDGYLIQNQDGKLVGTLDYSRPKREWVADLGMLGKRRYVDLDEARYDITSRNAEGWYDGHSQYDKISNPIVRIRFNERSLPSDYGIIGGENKAYAVVDHADNDRVIGEYDSREEAKAVAKRGKVILFVEEMQGPSNVNQQKMPDYLRKRIYDIGVKRILAYAKENGFDGIAWTTGDMQAKRYDLSRHFDKIEAFALDNNTYTIYGYDPSGKRIVDKQDMPQSDLSDVVGKELAQKIIDQPYRRGEYKDLDLKVGGEGLKRLYDTTLPALFKKYGKGSVSETGIGNNRYNVFDANGEHRIDASSQEAAEYQLQAFPNGSIKPNNSTMVPYFAVNDATPASYPMFSSNISAATHPELFTPKQKDVERYEIDIDRALAGNMRPDELVQAGDTPKVLQLLGAKPLPLGIDAGKVRKINKPKSQDGHGLTAEQIKQVIRQLHDPVLVMKSSETSTGKAVGGKSMVVVTELVDVDGKPIIAAIHIDDRHGRNMINRIASYYGRNDFKNFFTREILAGNVLYRQTQKSSSWHMTSGLQLPRVRGAMKSLTDSSVLTEKDVVKKFGDAKLSLTDSAAIQRARESLQNFKPEFSVDAIKQFLNPFDWSRSRELFESIAPDFVKNAAGWMFANPIYQAERDANKKIFVDTGIKREEDKISFQLAFMGWDGSINDAPSFKDRVKDAVTGWNNSDKATAWGRIQAANGKLSAADQRAVSVLLVEGDRRSKVYSSLEKAMTNETIAKAKPSEAAFQVYRAVRKHIDTVVANDRERIYTQMAREAGLDEKTIEKHISDYRQSLSERPGWLPRNHGEGKHQINVYHIIKDLKFEVKDVFTEGHKENSSQAYLPYYAGPDATQMMADIADRINEKYGQRGVDKGEDAKRLKFGSFINGKLLTANGQTIITGSKEDIAAFLKEAGDIIPQIEENNRTRLEDLRKERAAADGKPSSDIKELDKQIADAQDTRVRVKVFMRLHESKYLAKRTLEAVSKDMKKALPVNFREGELYEPDQKVADGMSESAFGDLAGDFAMERAQLEAIKRATQAGEITKEEAKSLRDKIIRTSAETLMGRGAGRHQIQRAPYLIEGYDTDDAVQLYHDYMTSTAGMLSKAMYAREQFENFRYADPDVKEWAEGYIKDSLRNMGMADRASGNARSVATLMALGLKASSVFVNGTQVWTLGVAELGRRTKQNSVKTIARAQKDIFSGNLSADEKKLFNSAIWKLQEMETVVHEVSGSGEGSTGKVSRNFQTLIGKAMMPFQEMELLNRKTMILAAYRSGKADGMNEQEAIDFALDVNRKTNFEMSRANLPGWARNPLGRTAYALQTFVWNNWNWVYNRATSGEKADMLALLKYGAMLAVIGGAQALAGGDEADKIYRRMFGRSIKLDLQQWTKENIGKYGFAGDRLNAFLWHGGMGALGLNISNAMRLNIPLSGVLTGDSTAGEAAMGIWGMLFSKMGNTVKYAGKGEYGKMLEAMAPAALESPLRAYRMATEGATDSHGKPILDEHGKQIKYTPREAVLRAGGFQPESQSHRTEVSQQERALKTIWSDKRQDALDRFRMERKLKYIAEFNKALKGSQAMGLVSPITAESIRRTLQNRMNKKRAAWQRAAGVE